MKTFQILSFVLALICVSCTISSLEDFVVGDNFINDNTGVVVTDTFTIESSSVRLDSIISNSSSRFLVGSNYNYFSGYKNTNSYLQMKFDDAIDNTTFVFDSINLVLYYDTYYFGDTTITQTFTVHQLEEPMELGSDGYLYSTTQFRYDNSPLGSINIQPRPRSHKKLSIRLSDTWGNKLANMIMEKNDTISQELLFSKFMDGLTIRCQGDVKGAVVGFRTTDSSNDDEDKIETKPEIRLYYHLSPNPENLTDLYYKFSFNSDGIYFNQITDHPASSLLGDISKSGNECSTNLTNQQSMVQCGTQVFSKYTFPYLNNLWRTNGNPAFIGATLKLFPVKGTYITSQLPDSLIIYAMTSKNLLTGQVTLQGNTTEMVFAKLNVIEDVEQTVFYSIDVSSFIGSELKNEQESHQSLAVAFASSTSMKSANHLIFGGHNSGRYAPKLNVYYFHN